MNPSILHQQKEMFLETLAAQGNVTFAARAAGWKYPTIAERYRAEDPAFSDAWTDAMDQAIDGLELEARRRALQGINEPVYYQGEVVGTVTKYSDKLLELLLKAHRPEKFGTLQAPQALETPGVLRVARSTNPAQWEADATVHQRELLASSG